MKGKAAAETDRTAAGGPRYDQRLVRRWGVQRLFRAAEKSEAERETRWQGWCAANPHLSGRPGIYRPEARRMSKRVMHAHQIASELYHEFIAQND